MSTQGALTPLPSSSSSKPRWKYEVFLSFKGEDTRRSFTDHLYDALKKKGILTFRDDEKLERGKSISEELLKAIEESRFAIIIFSENYASSRWCLDELVHIIRCKKEIGLEVVLVFYHVNPSDVRHQGGTFAQAFDKHKECFKESIEKVETWRAALREVANLSGWDLQDRGLLIGPLEPTPRTMDLMTAVRVVSLATRTVTSVIEPLALERHLQPLDRRHRLSKGQLRPLDCQHWPSELATEAIQAIVVTQGEEEINFEEFPEGFSKMSNLRLLIIKPNSLKKKKLGILNALDHVPSDQRHLALPNNLRHLSWNYCPFKCLASSGKRKAFVHLDLQYSKFEFLWEGVMVLAKLKFIDLSHSENLIRIPDFSGVPILEELNLSWCCSLVEIHPSIGQLSSLRYLHLQHCYSLTALPSMSVEMQSLTILNLSRCFQISMIPKFTGIMKSLSELYLGMTDIKKVAPSSVECLAALTLLDLSSCTNLKCLPSNMDNLRSLEMLNLFDCSKLKYLPRLPSTLTYINAEACSSLKSLLRLPSTLRYLNVRYCYSLKWSPTWVKLSSWSQLLSWWRLYGESGSRVEFTILFHFLEGLLCYKTVNGTSSKTEFQIIVPSWLTHQSVGNSISIELPSNWCNSKWMGFALWASLSGIIGLKHGIRVRVIALGDMPQNHCASELFTTWTHCGVSICLLYLFHDDWVTKVGECSHIKVIFETNESNIYVWKCGVSLVYEQDVDEFNQTNAQCLIESVGEVFIFKLSVGDNDDDDIHTIGDDND
uniref:TIR domain-containing protein n=1 Tax=Quercus lobata TaxID=97700 RepID=A0A7N2R4H2_QUELO